MHEMDIKLASEKFTNNICPVFCKLDKCEGRNRSKCHSVPTEVTKSTSTRKSDWINLEIIIIITPGLEKFINEICPIYCLWHKFESSERSICHSVPLKLLNLPPH